MRTERAETAKKKSEEADQSGGLPRIIAPSADFDARKLKLDTMAHSAAASGRSVRDSESDASGKCVRSSRENQSGRVHILHTVIAATGDGFTPDEEIPESSLRWQVLKRRTGTRIVFLVDSSGSMLARRKSEAAKGCILSLLKDAYVSRDQVAMIVFGGKEAELILPPTSSPELATPLLEGIRTGGRTPMLDAFSKANRFLMSASPMPTLFVVISDGKYSRMGVDDPEKELRAFGEACERQNAKILVIDAEKGGKLSLGMARRLSELLRGVFIPIDDMRADRVRSAVDSVIRI